MMANHLSINFYLILSLLLFLNFGINMNSEVYLNNCFSIIYTMYVIWIRNSANKSQKNLVIHHYYDPFLICECFDTFRFQVLSLRREVFIEKRHPSTVKELIQRAVSRLKFFFSKNLMKEAKIS